MRDCAWWVVWHASVVAAGRRVLHRCATLVRPQSGLAPRRTVRRRMAVIVSIPSRCRVVCEMRSGVFRGPHIDDEQDFLLIEVAGQGDAFLDQVVDEARVFGCVLSARCRSSLWRPTFKSSSTPGRSHSGCRMNERPRRRLSQPSQRDATLPAHDAVMAITHPGGGKSFDDGSYWEGRDPVYTGRGQQGNQKLGGANLDIADNRRDILAFEESGRLGDHSASGGVGVRTRSILRSGMNHASATAT